LLKTFFGGLVKAKELMQKVFVLLTFTFSRTPKGFELRFELVFTLAILVLILVLVLQK
jgi:hypothetical protein